MRTLIYFRLVITLISLLAGLRLIPDGVLTIVAEHADTILKIAKLVGLLLA